MSLHVFIFIVATINFVAANNPESTIDTISTSDEKDFTVNTEKYVQLLFVPTFREANDLSKTINGRLKLKSWSKQRNALARRLFLNKENLNFGKSYSWQDNLPDKMKKFTDLQIEIYPKYLQNVETIVDDRLANDEEIENVLRYHKPYTNDELQKLDLAESMRSDKVNQANEKNLNFIPEDLLNNVKSQRSLIKKYHVIDRDFLKKFQTARYELLKKSLEGKRLSELRYQELLFKEERLTAATDVWNKREHNNFYQDNTIVSLGLLSNDDDYRKYLNLHDVIFRGNVIYAPKDRYDEPKKHNLDFEVTSEPIIGKLYKPMLEVYEEMRRLYFLTNSFTDLRLEQLPIFDDILERFKFLTFWFPQSRYNDDNWLPLVKGKWIWSKNIKKQSSYVVLDAKHVEKSDKIDIEKVRQELDVVLADAKKKFESNVKTQDDATIFERNQKLIYKSIEKDAILMQENLIHMINVKKIHVFTDRVIRYTQSLNRANLLDTLTINPLNNGITSQRDKQSLVKSEKNNPEDELMLVELVDNLKKLNEDDFKTSSNVAEDDIKIHQSTSNSGDDTSIHQHYKNSNANSNKNKIHVKHH